MKTGILMAALWIGWALTSSVCAEETMLKKPWGDKERADLIGSGLTPIESSSGTACDQVLYPANDTGGCHVRLVTPDTCEEVDLSNGKLYQFAWTTDGSYCETPWYLYIAGNPADTSTGENIHWWSLSENVEQGITHYGGIINVNAAVLASVGLTSTDGVYHWVVAGWHGSHPASKGFIINTTGKYTITTSVSPEGSGTVTCVPNPVDSGSNSVCTVTPGTGYHVDAVTADSNPVTLTNGTTYTFTNVTSTHTISAAFEADPNVSPGRSAPGTLLLLE